MPTLTLRAKNGFYVRADPDGRLIADQEFAGPSATFIAATIHPGTVALRTMHGTYVGAVAGGGGLLLADRQQIGPWETFQIVAVMGGIALRTCDGAHYVRASEDGTLMADRAQIGPSEIFNAPR